MRQVPGPTTVVRSRPVGWAEHRPIRARARGIVAMRPGHAHFGRPISRSDVRHVRGNDGGSAQSARGVGGEDGGCSSGASDRRRWSGGRTEARIYIRSGPRGGIGLMPAQSLGGPALAMPEPRDAGQEADESRMQPHRRVLSGRDRPTSGAGNLSWRGIASVDVMRCRPAAPERSG